MRKLAYVNTTAQEKTYSHETAIDEWGKDFEIRLEKYDPEDTEEKRVAAREHARKVEEKRRARRAAVA